MPFFMSQTSPAINPPVRSTAPTQEPGEDAVRAYAYHLYEQGGGAPGHDLDNWLEATACLKAHIPAHSSYHRLHLHINAPEMTSQLAGSPAEARREQATLRRGREDLETSPTADEIDVRTSLFDDHP